MRPEPNFPVRPDEFVGRRQQIEAFREALRQGLAAGRTSSFAILGDWGIGKSSLLLKFAAVCAEPAYAILPILFSASTDIHDYMRSPRACSTNSGMPCWLCQTHREHRARLVEKGVLIRTGRARYKLYHQLFREFLRQTK